MVPVLVCLVVIGWVVQLAEAIFGALPRLVLPAQWYFPGLGILVALVVIMLVGTFLHFWVVDRLFRHGERLLERIPLVKTLYTGARDLLRFFSRAGEGGDLRHAVLVELQEDVHAIGFVTSDNAGEDFPELRQRNGERLVAVYLQMGYQVGGYTLYLPASRVRRLDIPVEEALRVVLTANVNRPRR